MSQPYTYYVNPIGSPNGTVIDAEEGSVHQSSPTWVLTFLRWADTDTERIVNSDELLMRSVLVVENDCIQVSVSDAKSTLTPSMGATLVMTDVNYESSVHPGDFVFVNMLNWPSRARRVADAARAYKPINGPNDGFKGVFKVQSVRRTEQVDPNTGVKTLFFKITGFAFTEFNNIIYFNPSLLDTQNQQNQLIFATNISQDWASLVNDKGLFAVQDIIALLIQSLIGKGLDDAEFVNSKDLLVTTNTHFEMPKEMGKFLGLKKVEAAKDIYRYLFGIQQYAGGNSRNSSAYKGMNPTIDNLPFSGFYYTKTKCEGSTQLKPEFWNQVQTWSILNQYTNAPLNEIYTCFRLSPDNRVMPTLVFRQIPFTNLDFELTLANDPNNISPVTLETTKFLKLPRWKIHPALVISRDIGTDEAARINFVQYFSRSIVGDEGAAIAAENAQGNYMYDVKDVKRNGLKPYIISTQFEDVTALDKDTYHSPQWARIVGDAVIGGHLKLNGTIECAGIVAPIAVGDNLEFDGVVYHIEQIHHSASIQGQDGHKIFRTVIALSHGISLKSSSKGLRYAEMTHTRAYTERRDDWNNNRILPGVSEAQDTVYRKNGRVEPNQAEIKQGDAPFTQPGQKSRSTRNTDD